jgi:hypothetical protein
MLERFLIKSIISFSEELKAKGLFLLFLILFNNILSSNLTKKIYDFLKLLFLYFICKKHHHQEKSQ